MTLQEYIRGRPCQGFRPHPYYSPDGDFMVVYFEDVPCHSERIDEWLTVFKADDDGRVVGCKIKGLKLLMARG